MVLYPPFYSKKILQRLAASLSPDDPEILFNLGAVLEACELVCFLRVRHGLICFLRRSS
jgi:hypothetical protein